MAKKKTDPGADPVSPDVAGAAPHFPSVEPMPLGEGFFCRDPQTDAVHFGATVEEVAEKVWASRQGAADAALTKTEDAPGEE